MKLRRWPEARMADEQAVLGVLRSGNWHNGPAAGELEKAWSERLGVDAKRMVAVSSCTHALHLAVLGTGAGRVYVPATSYIGTATPVLLAGAELEFVDIEPKTHGMSPEALEDRLRLEGGGISAVIAVHLHGMPCWIDMIAAVCQQAGVPLIEDACQAHGARRGERWCGTFGDWAAWSLNAVKPLPAGQGGLLLCPSEEAADEARWRAGPGDLLNPGRSYPITEMAAALATSQLTRLDETLDESAETIRAFEDEAGRLEHFSLPIWRAGDRPTWHKYRVRVRGVERRQAVQKLAEREVLTSRWADRTLPREAGRDWEKCPEAEALCLDSFVLGDEKYPFAIQGVETARAWARAFREVDEEL